MKNKMIKILLKLLFGLVVGFGVGFLAAKGVVTLREQELTLTPFFQYDLLYAGLILSVLILFMIYMKQLLSLKSAYPANEAHNDDTGLSIEKGFYNLISVSSLMVILSMIWLLFAVAHLVDRPDLVEVKYLAIFGFIALVATFVSQFYAFRLHNQFFPNKKFHFTADKPDEKYFQQMDEGEKYETYRISFITFKKMINVFAIALLIVFFYSLLISFQVVAILAVAGLWVTMLLIYHFEGYKSYKS